MAKQTLGKYEVLERLGRGGMAEVFRGYHATLDRYVAIKVLHPFLAEDDEFRARFEKEARHIAKLSHPHIVQVYDFDFSDDRDSYYMVMELIAGITLKDRLYDLASRHERLPVPEVLRIVREAATALAYAHKRSMIHRDVKPANLMLDEDDRVVLTDFGIAKMLDSKQLTVSGGMIGTPAYMSPEQGLGEPGDERSDLYSLGVIMYQLLVGDLPYDAETALGVILMHVNDPIPIVRSYNPDVPQSVQNVVHRAMEKDPLKRYQTADELIADLDQCAVELDGGEAAVISPSNAELSSKTGGADETSDDGAQDSTTTEDRLRPQASPGGAQRRFPWSVVLTVLLLVVGLGGGGIMASNAGLLPGFVQDTPTPTVDVSATSEIMTATAADEQTAIALAQVTDTPTVTDTEAPTEPPPTDTQTPTATDTDEPTPTATETERPTATATDTPTPTPTVTDTPTITPNVTETQAAIQTATIEACEFDYAVIEQVFEGTVVADELPVYQISSAFTMDITLLNTGTCEWGENTSLTFVSGEDFDAGVRIFIRESVGAGEEYTLVFEGSTPSQGLGNEEPLEGVWQLRTRGQKDIGGPLTISIFVFG